MKHYILSLLTLAALVVGAQAQGLVTMTGGSFNIVASTTSNGVFSSSYVIDVRRQQNVAIEWTSHVNGTGLNGIRFVPSIDGSTVATSVNDNGFVMAVAPSANVLTYVVTNFNVKGYNYLVLHGATNGSANTLTNTIRYWVKPNAP